MERMKNNNNEANHPLAGGGNSNNTPEKVCRWKTSIEKCPHPQPPGHTRKNHSAIALCAVTRFKTERPSLGEASGEELLLPTAGGMYSDTT
jgi:hypothetical protein